jgi:hypothetical protein
MITEHSSTRRLSPGGYHQECPVKSAMQRSPLNLPEFGKKGFGNAISTFDSAGYV